MNFTGKQICGIVIARMKFGANVCIMKMVDAPTFSEIQTSK